MWSVFTSIQRWVYGMMEELKETVSFIELAGMTVYSGVNAATKKKEEGNK